MKKILKPLFSLCLLAVILLLAQSYANKPLFGTAKNQDNTGRQVTYFYTSIADTAGATPDTITIIPDGYDKYYNLTLADSCVIAVKSTASSFTGSHIKFIINNGAVSGWVKFLGYSGLTTQWLCNTTGTTKISPTASHTAIISYVCTGTAWAEEYRSQD